MKEGKILSPTLTLVGEVPRGLPPLIAVVGCDGSGKSTVTAELLSWLGKQQPTAVCHLGKQSGNVGRAIARWPLFGGRLDKSIKKRSRKAEGKKGPGLLAALVIYAFLLRRKRRFVRMMGLRAKGYTIIADRFPQLELTRAIDGPGLSGATAGGLVGYLAAAERRAFVNMVAQAPDLVLRLNVSLDVAVARKPDHDYSALARKVAVVPRLRFGNAPIVELNADAPLDQVLSQARAAVSDLIANRK